MRRCLLALAALLCISILAPPARADVLLYKLGKRGQLKLALQGKVTINAGGTVTYQHPKFGNLYFALDQIEHIKARSIPDQFRRRLDKAKSGKQADEVFEAGIWALKHGLLRDFYETVEETLKIDSKHSRALLVQSLREKMKAPLSDSSQQEAELRALAKRPQMKIASSAHFIMLHDTPEQKHEGHKKKRSEERLDLLEHVYESFLLLFYAHGVELHVPQERLKVLLFNEYKDFKDFSVAFSPSLASAAGFWEAHINTGVFFDFSSFEENKSLLSAANELDDLADTLNKKAKGAGKDLKRFAQTIRLLALIHQEDKDIEVVSHECTHQMAGNTGLLPKGVSIPAWVHEGLATYFEAPADASWSGIGAVNERRLSLYKILESQARIDVIVGDQVFDFAGNNIAVEHGYSQAWSMTHFLMETRFDKLMEYYRLLGEMPRDLDLSPAVLTSLFTRVFGDLKPLEQEWRAYMRQQKTDLDKILDKDKL